MRKLIRYFMLILCIISFTNCSDDDHSVIVPSPELIVPPDKDHIHAIREEALNPLYQRITFNADEEFEFVSRRGIKVLFIPGSFYLNGERVTGDIELEFIEIFERGDMVTTHKPLMGVDDSNNLLPLVTAGEFFINLTQNGKRIQCEYYNMIVPVQNAGEPNYDMTLWKGYPDDNSTLIWNHLYDLEMNYVYPNGEENTYEVLLSELGWVSIDALYEFPGEQTKISVKVPEGYTDQNSSVYTAYKEEPNMLAFLSAYDLENKLFTEHYGSGCVGFDLYVIFLSEYKGKYVYAIKDVTITENEIINIENSELKTATREELTSIINELPQTNVLPQ